MAACGVCPSLSVIFFRLRQGRLARQLEPLLNAIEALADGVELVLRAVLALVEVDGAGWSARATKPDLRGNPPRLAVVLAGLRALLHGRPMEFAPHGVVRHA
jgi:hypothetical protein